MEIAMPTGSLVLPLITLLRCLNTFSSAAFRKPCAAFFFDRLLKRVSVAFRYRASAVTRLLNARGEAPRTSAIARDVFVNSRIPRLCCFEHYSPSPIPRTLQPVASANGTEFQSAGFPTQLKLRLTHLCR